jgi:hypothetical protein
MNSQYLPLLLLSCTLAVSGFGLPSVGGKFRRGGASPLRPQKQVLRARKPGMKWGVDIAPWALAYGQQAAPVRLPPGVREGDPPLPFEVSEEQCVALEEDGAVVIRGLLDEQWLAYLRDVTDWQVPLTSPPPVLGHVLTTLPHPTLSLPVASLLLHLPP